MAPIPMTGSHHSLEITKIVEELSRHIRSHICLDDARCFDDVVLGPEKNNIGECAFGDSGGTGNCIVINTARAPLV